MGVSGYGIFFCLWAICASSAQGRTFTEPWATPPTAGTTKIKRGVVYNPTIHHGNLLEKIVILGAASHGLHHRLWAIRAGSAQGRAFTEPWAMPPTAGAMKIKQGVMYYPTIHHGYLLEKNCRPGRRQPRPPPPPMGRPRPVRSRERIDRAMGDAPYRRCHENQARGDVLPNNPP